MWFTRYDNQTGDIIGHMQGDRNLAEANPPYIDGRFSPEEFRVVDGVAVPKDASEIEAQEIAKAWGNLRNLRDGLLKDSDWTQVPDAPVDQAAWKAYRQALRDLPANTTDPRQVVWPTQPS